MTSFTAWVITVGSLLAAMLITLALAWLVERKETP